MKLNTKDIVAGAILLGIALVGLWLNTDHNMGSARRMGPGYMPFLALAILGGLGAATVIFALFSGPNPLDRWTSQEIMLLIAGAVVGTGAGLVAARVGGWPSSGWNSLGIGIFVGCLVPGIVKSWRPLFLVLAAFALFGLVLEQLGLMVAITLSVVLAAFADETHTPKGVVGLCVFLCTLCWFVFIWYLDIRVPLWPQL